MDKIYIEVEKTIKTPEGKTIKCVKDYGIGCEGCCIPKINGISCIDMICEKSQRDCYRREQLKDFNGDDSETIYELIEEENSSKQ